MHLKLGQISAIVVSSATLAREVLKTFDIACCSRPHKVATSELSYGGSDIAFMPYGERWRQLRKLCTVEFFSARKINSFTSVREDEIARMARHMSISLLGSRAPSPSTLQKDGQLTEENLKAVLVVTIIFRLDVEKIV
ncbi:hypothetical protein ZIOFF_072693 [Zingiber officinale]|uniref:Uncharacterized protein n=1 Tax=Zingiber officinale TaxID=94328 RepID=A0A8J5C6H3_ZINOF|nr:hypothetical protein ZIOFF_072693 [Zingiber officinale]